MPESVEVIRSVVDHGFHDSGKFVYGTAEGNSTGIMVMSGNTGGPCTGTVQAPSVVVNGIL